MISAKRKTLLPRIKDDVTKVIIWHIPYIKLLNLGRFSKKFHSFICVSLYHYQKYFLLKKIPINFSTVPFNDILLLLNKEFKNFDKAGDEICLRTIIEEIKASEKEMEINKKDKDILGKYEMPIIESFQNIKMKKIIDNPIETNIIALYLDSFCDNKNNLIFPRFEQMKIAPGPYQNLKILKINNNFDVPASMLVNLIKLHIIIISNNFISISNDLGKRTITLNNLKFLKIFRRRSGYSNTIRDLPQFYLNRVGFRFPNIEQIILNLDLNEDLYILKEYLKMNLIDNNLERKMNRGFASVYNYFKEKILNYDFHMMAVNFKFDILFRKDKEKIIINSEMIKSKNGLKNYHFIRTLYRNKKRLFHIVENYKENNFNKKNISVYFNNNGFNGYHDKFPLIKETNSIGLLSKRKKNIDKYNISNLFNIRENNYSIQHIIIDIGKGEKYFEKLIKNITKFKILKNLMIQDYFVDFDIFIRLLKGLSKLKLLGSVRIHFKGNLNENDIKIVKKYFPKISISEIENTGIIKFEFNKDKNNN